MKIHNSKEEIKQGKYTAVVGDRIAVIVLTVIDKDNACYGVQYWTHVMIADKSQKNTDNTISVFIEQFN